MHFCACDFFFVGGIHIRPMVQRARIRLSARARALLRTAAVARRARANRLAARRRARRERREALRQQRGERMYGALERALYNTRTQDMPHGVRYVPRRVLRETVTNALNWLDTPQHRMFYNRHMANFIEGTQGRWNWVRQFGIF